MDAKPGAAKPADAEKPDAEKKPEPKVESHQVHLFVHQRRNRVLIGHVGVELLDVRDEPIKPSQTGRVERLRETFARFIEAHENGGSDDLRSWQETPGLAEAMPEGEPLVDAMVNLRGLIALLNGCSVGGFCQPHSKSFVDTKVTAERNRARRDRDELARWINENVPGATVTGKSGQRTVETAA